MSQPPTGGPPAVPAAPASVAQVQLNLLRTEVTALKQEKQDLQTNVLRHQSQMIEMMQAKDADLRAKDAIIQQLMADKAVLLQTNADLRVTLAEMGAIDSGLPTTPVSIPGRVRKRGRALLGPATPLHDSAAAAAPPTASPVSSTVWRGVRCVRRAKISSEVLAFAVFPDQTLAVGCWDGRIHVYKPGSALSKKSIVVHGSAAVWDVAVVDGNLVSAGKVDKSQPSAVIKVWTPSETVVLSGHKGDIYCLASLPDSVLASGADDATIRLWKTSGTPRCLMVLKGHSQKVFSLAVLNSGLLASGSADGEIKVWKDGACEYSLTGHTGGVYAPAALPGNRLVSGSYDKTVRVWDGRACMSNVTAHTDTVQSLAVLPDGSAFVSGSDDNSVKVWSTDGSGTCLGTLKGHKNWVRAVACFADGTIVSGSDEKMMRLWKSVDSGDGMEVGTGAGAGAGAGSGGGGAGPGSG